MEGLPEEVMRRVVGYLGYGNAMSLARTCRLFRDGLRPVEETGVLSRWEFVRGRERYRSGPDSEVTLGCFACFRVKRAEKFTFHEAELAREEAWKRRCMACCRWHESGEGEAERARETWERQRLCGACGMLRYVDASCEGCVVLAETDAASDHA